MPGPRPLHAALALSLVACTSVASSGDAEGACTQSTKDINL